MKKLIAMLLALTMALSLAACGAKTEAPAAAPAATELLPLLPKLSKLPSKRSLPTTTGRSPL